MLAGAGGSRRERGGSDHESREGPNRRKVRELIGGEAIGEVRHLELVLKPYLRGDGRPQAYAAPWTWWFDAARGGGILGAVGSHYIDLVRYWTGSEPSQVAGGAATFVTERRDERGIAHRATAEEFASFTMRMAGGAVATMLFTTVAHHGPGHFAPVMGSEGTCVLTGEPQREMGEPAGPPADASAPD